MRAWLSWVVLACVFGTPALGITVDAVPRPPRGTWSVDTTGKLSADTRAEVNRLGAELDAQGRGQLAVVVVDTTSGRGSRDFALTLFNRWGIGHAGVDDGALLFIALSDRKAEIILGDGVDGPRDQAASDALMSGTIIPAFKRGDPDGAVRDGARGLHQLLQQSELFNPSAATASGEQDTQALPPQEAPYIPGTVPSSYESVYAPEPTSSTPDVGLLAGGVGVLGAAGLAGRALLRRRPRKCRACGGKRERLDEAADDDHIDAGQRREEKLGSVDYDVWWCNPCEDAVVERYGTLFTRYARCAQCRYVTSDKTTRTLRAATYDHGGEVEVTLRCKHCGNVSTSRHSTPRLTRSSSSSSSGSRSSSSSFGGGRSSGGGSSGSW
ncbi:TPM domain-containing protein [Pyxidicoccus xibeiensis]|uniref:TPM domain-containing protein n=1 Tax=Pyxidicoccus xibeiensis TaxID=2906759 RepID=UPI0020A75011|nr:TPM domain-containing protein [Pyxidicoccus xibeiensis]MCP3137700.1 TPM domain-containing protein [Pyxidicoccus xibeiensis]